MNDVRRATESFPRSGIRSHATRLLDAAAHASDMTYEHLNPVAAGLVARPEHMPRTTLDWGHWNAVAGRRRGRTSDRSPGWTRHITER